MIITPDLFKKLQEVGERYCKMPDTLSEIAKKNNSLPTEIQYMQKFYTQQKYEVEKLKIELDELYGQLYKHYRIDDDIQWNTTKEIESQIYADTGTAQEDLSSGGSLRRRLRFFPPICSCAACLLFLKSPEPLSTPRVPG